MPYVPSFFTCLHCFTCFTCLHFYACLMCFHFFACLTRHHFFTCLHFLCAFNLFMYMLIKLTQINELYLCSSLLLLNSVIYQRLSSILTSTKFMSYSAWFFLFLKQKMLTIFNSGESTWPLERLEHYLKREIQRM